MKVLIVAPFFFERHRWMISAYKTALELAKEHEVIVLTAGTPRFEQIGPHLVVHRLFDFFLPDPVNYSIVPNLFLRLFLLVRRERPDVVLVNKHMFFTSFAVVLLRCMRRKVILAIDTYPGINWLPRKRFVALIMRIYAWCIGVPLLKLATMVVLYHEGLIEIAERLRLRYCVIHNGVETERFDAALPAGDIPKGSDRLNIGYVGRLETIKGYDDFVEVAENLSRKHANMHFYVVGNTAGKGSYVLQHSGERIHFLGHRDDIAGIYKQLDVFVLCSYSEGLPNALMEAMYCALPCVASRVGGVRTLIRDGETGLMFQPGDRGGLASHLVRLAQDPALRRRLGEAARARIMSAYTWEAIRTHYHKLFLDILSS